MKREQRLSQCGGCGSEDPLLLYNAGPRSSGIYRRLCPACVLKSHQGSFCPVCFDLIDDSPSPCAVMCRTCHCLSHSSCVPSSSSSSPSPPAYHCPPCSNPNFLYFPPYPKKSKLHQSSSSDDDADGRTLDKDSAKALLAAVRISAASMSKAANVARVEAEKRVKEAAFAKKRAREALERVAAVNIRTFKGPPAIRKPQPPYKVDNALPVQRRIQDRPGHDGLEKPVPPTNHVSSEAKQDLPNHSPVPVDKDSNGLHSLPHQSSH